MKRFLTLTGTAILLIHFTLIIVFCFPNYFGKSHLLGISKKYLFPIFNQNWQMFAPEPPRGAPRLYFRCMFEDEKHTAWVDPGQKLVAKHQANRFWNYGKLFNIYESIHRELKYADMSVNYILEKDTVNTNLRTKRNKLISEKLQYKMAANYFIKQAQNTFINTKINHIDFMYVYTTLPPINDKAGNKSYEVIIFPTIYFANNLN